MIAKFLFLISTARIALSQAVDCKEGFTICEPPDATTITTPKIGDEAFRNLYIDILQSSLPTFKFKRSLLVSRDTPSLCCITSLSCLTMANLALPFCYDEFTTNYFLPDNSYGTLVGGTYNSSTGDSANLLTGDYTFSNGSKGNIYSANKSSKPDTKTLAIPSQWTGTGVGSAIPASELGGRITRTYTTTLPGTTVPATTIAAQVVTSTNGPGTVVVTTIVEESTVGAKTIAPMVITLVTTEVALASSSTAAVASTSSKSPGVKTDANRLGYWVMASVLLMLPVW